MSDANRHRLFIITGDYSGDIHAANVVKAIKAQRPDLEIAGVGGSNMAAQGVQLIGDQSQMGVMGLGALSSVPHHYFLGKRILAFLKTFRPQAVLLIDYGGFNLLMAAQIKRLGIKVLYFIPPQVWASRRGRLRKIKANVDHVFCIFPFEEALYQSHQIPVTYVGHPLVGELPPPVDRASFCRTHGLDAEKPILGIFPGSRRMEIDYLLTEIVGSLPEIAEAHPRVQFVLAKAASLKPDYFQKKLQESLKKQRQNGAMNSLPPITIVDNENHALLSASDAVIAKSGTTTLEAALYRTPMIIIYKGPWLSYHIAKRLCYLPCIGLPNILTDMDKPPIQELWQDAVNPKDITRSILPLFNPHSTERQKQESAFEKIHHLFSVGNAPSNVAQGVLTFLETH